MASKNKIIEMIGSIKTIYPYYAKDTNVELLVKTWDALLKEYPDEVIDVAFFRCLQTCKMPPTPAEVIEVIKDLSKANEPTDDELWAMFTDALAQTRRLYSAFTYTFEIDGITQGEIARRKFAELWDNLNPKIKTYVGTDGELIRLAREIHKEDMKFERNRFMKNIPIIEKRIEYKKILLNSGVGNLMLE